MPAVDSADRCEATTSICRNSPKVPTRRRPKVDVGIRQPWQQFATGSAASAAILQPSFTAQATLPADLQGLSERMMGLEPTTFCMASASDVRARSHTFARTAWSQAARPVERTRANPSERQTLPSLPRLVRDLGNLASLPGRSRSSFYRSVTTGLAGSASRRRQRGQRARGCWRSCQRGSRRRVLPSPPARGRG